MDVIFLTGSPTVNTVFNRYVGPYKISHWIKKHGLTSQVIDFINHFSEDQLYTAIKKFIDNDTVAFAMSTTFLCSIVHTHSTGAVSRLPENVYNVLKKLKKEYPKIKLITGGYMSDRLANWGIVDATVMSYTEASEDIFLEYIQHLKKGTPAPLGQLRFPEFSNLAKKPKPRMIYDKARNPVYNIELDDFKFTKQDAILQGEYLPLDVSRGCIFACRFCQYPHLGKGKLDYIRAMSLLEEELINNYDQFGTTRYAMLDDTFNDTEWKMQEFKKMTERLPFKISYSAYIRADLVHRFPDTAHLLKESGLFGAYMGLESLHPYASKLVGKGWSGKEAKGFIPDLYHNIWKEEVPIHTNFIVGLPKETEKDLLDTVAWFKDNNLYSIYFSALGLWGKENKVSKFSIQSEFDRNSEKYGFSFEPGTDNWYNETWTRERAYQVSIELNKIVKPLSKTEVWAIGAYEWYGFSKSEIINNSRSNIPWDKVVEITTHKHQEYYNQLMSL